MNGDAAPDRSFVEDRAERARRTLPAELWAYLSGGAETGAALRRNRDALDAVALVPRVLVDVSEVACTATLLGHVLPCPIMLAPVGSLHTVHEQGAAGVQRTAESAGVAYALGSALPDAGALRVAPGACALFQLYVDGDQDWLHEQCAAAIDRGYSGIVITVDAPVFPVRPADVRTGNHAALRSVRDTGTHRRSFDWAALRRLVVAHPGIPFFIKGIQDPDDAVRARDLGVAGIHVSNHGGRQFDQGAGTLALLGPIARALDGSATLIVDGGFETGNDVLKALALGADVVALGRAYLYAYALDGETGLAAYLSALRGQIRTNMALLGTPTLADLRGLRVLRR
ncbi:alpha-hydroxy-acid oxidizing protein [Pigmentiphaga sp. GD03639]|uniref:alpha-hydroxy acid oxidase n=1 Tax=Pigmentiphaga sp. GD03639 TaxID=2975354 RepID=UPI002446FB64|nr:alpha-hydroxy acid oxidase [Pigmentiphaga sp. GD03639]MDH2238338.1 alpha-hydroxy-acid oxidizing protein [Pigmentiphaga sp. GD03639]